MNGCDFKESELNSALIGIINNKIKTNDFSNQTQEQIGKYLGMTQSMINELMNYKTRLFSVRSFGKYCKTLDLPVLFNGEMLEGHLDTALKEKLIDMLTVKVNQIRNESKDFISYSAMAKEHNIRQVQFSYILNRYYNKFSMQLLFNLMLSFGYRFEIVEDDFSLNLLCKQ
ncbi:hypothetical protein KW496_19645 [Vibrio fluvialis]|nr:hypothetical protein [Vibrio fluvialis]